MARSSRLLLLLGADQAQVLAISSKTAEIVFDTAGLETTDVDRDQALLEWFRQQSITSEPILIALKSELCLSDLITVPTPRQGRNREAMSYLLEPSLPWAAEETVIDYELHGTQAFMVAAESEPLRQLISQLEEIGVLAASVVPQAQLALQQHLTAHPKLAERYLFLWEDAATIHAWLIKGQQVEAWRSIPAAPEMLDRTIRQLLLTESLPLKLAQRNLEPELASTLLAYEDLELLEVNWKTPDSLSQATIQQALPILTGKQSSSIELLRDELITGDPLRPIRGHLRMLQVSILLLLLSVIGVLYYQTQQYNELRLDYGDQQSALFRKTFPNQRERVGILTPLRSELNRLRGVKGQAAELPETISALEVLSRLMDSLPEEFRFQIRDVNIKEGQMTLRGIVREYSDVEHLEQKLQQTGLQAQIENTTRLSRQDALGSEISFLMTAELPVPTEPIQEGQL